MSLPTVFYSLKSLSKLFILFCFIVFSCNNSSEPGKKRAVLLADREATLGWVYLQVYDDSTFNFISRGLREQTIYSGTYKLIKDTLFFSYKDSIPKAGKTAIISKRRVSYIDGNYPESVEIKINNLTR